MEVHLDALLSAVGGCAMAGFIAKYAITKALRDLDDLFKKVTGLGESLAVISVRLEKLVEHDNTLKEHAKKLAYFEGVSHDSRSPRILQ